MAYNNNGNVQPQRVLLTGHNGYIGSVMVQYLIDAGHKVTGLDTGYFRPCTLIQSPTVFPQVWKDIRNLERRDVEGFDAVVHLAALSNDPIGNLNERWTEEINFEASVRLAELARDTGVKRLLFSSSCIMYGMSETSDVNEDSPLAPQTEYARSKVKTEDALRNLARPGFSPTYLRNGTVYGLSPRMRFDTVFNDLVGAAVTTGKVMVYSDGKPWRPVVHVRDVSRAFLNVLQAPIDAIHNQAFNVGANNLNHQIIQLAEIAVKTVPGSKLEVLARPGADQRTYRTDFGKFARTFPEFQFNWNAETGAQELYRAFTGNQLTHEIFTDRKFTRLKWLRHLLDSNQLDPALRWQIPQEAAIHD
jgi:nucleoside-diphosphate-sugar epimerase